MRVRGRALTRPCAGQRSSSRSSRCSRPCPARRARTLSTKRILQDCVDGQIDGKYSNADLARARKEIPAEAAGVQRLRERDLPGSHRQQHERERLGRRRLGWLGLVGRRLGRLGLVGIGRLGGGGSSAGSSASSGGGSGSAGDATPSGSSGASGTAQGAAEQAALRAATRGGGSALRLGPDTLVKPGATGIPASEALRRAVPDPLLVALILLGAIALVGVVLGARARVITRRPG